MQDTWKTLSKGQTEDHRIFKVRTDTVRNPKTGETLDIAMLTGNDSVNVLVVTKQQMALFVDIYRFGISDYVLDLPGGMVDDGEDHQQAAKRELLEETGYTAPEWHYLGCVASNPVFMDSFVHHYLALGAEPTADTEHEAGEDITLREISLDKVRHMLHNGDFLHPHTVSGVLRGLRFLEAEDGGDG